MQTFDELERFFDVDINNLWSVFLLLLKMTLLLFSSLALDLLKVHFILAIPFDLFSAKNLEIFMAFQHTNIYIST